MLNLQCNMEQLVRKIDKQIIEVEDDQLRLNLQFNFGELKDRLMDELTLIQVQVGHLSTSNEQLREEVTSKLRDLCDAVGYDYE